MRRKTAVGFLVVTVVNLVLVQPLSVAQQSEESGRKILSRVNPLYPELARRMQIHGTVKVEATVGPNGKVKSTKVIGGSPVLTKAALDAIEVWKWAPASSETKQLIELSFQQQ